MIVTNECGKCTLCCKLTNISQMNSPQGEYCKKCSKSKGCSIYISKPKECITFRCMYLQMKKVHKDLRPDNCGVMFEKKSDSLILATTDGTLENVSDLIKRQIKSFEQEGFSVMFQQFNPYKSVCFMVKGVKKEDILKVFGDKIK